jgi:ADP-ribose diphosphatase
MLKAIILNALFLFVSLHADPYNSILKNSKPYGSCKKKEIEIVSDYDNRKQIEKNTQDTLLKKGFTSVQAKKFSKTGIIAEDQYWIWVRDAVLFPSGFSGTYDRLLLKNADNLTPGAAALAVTGDNKIAVIICYRHATRSWEVELPRGSKQKNESAKTTAIRELNEETGFVVKKTKLLGKMTPDSGLIASIVPVFFMEIDYKDSFDHDQSEAISKTILIPKEELFTAIEKGYLKFEGKKIPLRDSFLAFAILQAKLKGLL